MSFLKYIDAVFGWLLDSSEFTGIEQESAYSLLVGYQKGAEQVGVDSILMLNVMIMILRNNAGNCDVA